MIKFIIGIIIGFIIGIIIKQITRNGDFTNVKDDKKKIRRNREKGLTHKPEQEVKNFLILETLIIVGKVITIVATAYGIADIITTDVSTGPERRTIINYELAEYEEFKHGWVGPLESDRDREIERREKKEENEILREYSRYRIQAILLMEVQKHREIVLYGIVDYEAPEALVALEVLNAIDVIVAETTVRKDDALSIVIQTRDQYADAAARLDSKYINPMEYHPYKEIISYKK